MTPTRSLGWVTFLRTTLLVTGLLAVIAGLVVAFVGPTIENPGALTPSAGWSIAGEGLLLVIASAVLEVLIAIEANTRPRE